MIVVGETLADCFEDGSEVIGGAPLNVAWNLTGLGTPAQFISAVGDDATGRKALAALTDWGLDLTCVDVLSDHPTGRVNVTLHGGQPSYEIAYPVAYDFIASPDSFTKLRQIGSETAAQPLIYIGSLAWRRPESQPVLEAWMKQFGDDRFVDINVRQPWFRAETIRPLLSGARYVKLNDDELGLLTGLPVHSDDEISLAIWRLIDQYGFQTAFVTCGARGAWVFEAENHTSAFTPASSPPSLTDTVGAGDALAAAVIDGLYHGLAPSDCLKRGTAFASRICGIGGATSTDRSLYHLEDCDDGGNP